MTGRIWKYVFLTISLCCILVISSLIGLLSLRRAGEPCESLTPMSWQKPVFNIARSTLIISGGPSGAVPWSPSTPLAAVLLSYLGHPQLRAHRSSLLCRTLLCPSPLCPHQLPAQPLLLISLILSHSSDLSSALRPSWHQLARFRGGGEE